MRDRRGPRGRIMTFAVSLRGLQTQAPRGQIYCCLMPTGNWGAGNWAALAVICALYRRSARFCRRSRVTTGTIWDGNSGSCVGPSCGLNRNSRGSASIIPWCHGRTSSGGRS